MNPSIANSVLQPYIVQQTTVVSLLLDTDYLFFMLLSQDVSANAAFFS